jgi:hypothetical protein
MFLMAALLYHEFHVLPMLKKRSERHWPTRDCFASIAMLGSCFHDLTNSFKQAPEDDGSSPAGEDARQKKRALMIMKHCGHVMISAIDVWKAVTI